MTAALEGDEWSAARPDRTLPLGKTRYPFYRRLGGPQGRSGQAENLVPTGIRSLDRPARSSVAIPTELPGPPMEEEDIAFILCKRPPQHSTYHDRIHTNSQPARGLLNTSPIMTGYTQTVSQIPL